MRLTWRKFRNVFGFEPVLVGLESYSALAKSAEQKIVDEKLTELASAFLEVDRKERALQADLEGTEGQDALLALREKAREIRREVQTTKHAFWLAHKLAKEADFSVREKSADYLPSAKYR